MHAKASLKLRRVIESILTDRPGQEFALSHGTRLLPAPEVHEHDF